MSYLLFIDESGHDHGASPYEVLAGIAIPDRDLWNLISAVANAEIVHFGLRYTQGSRELKGKKLLKTKTFRLARRHEPYPPEERRALARVALQSGSQASREQVTALAQAKLAFAQHLLQLCAQFRCKVFASVVLPSAPKPAGDGLRKDYAYLFERFFYFLEDQGTEEMGLVVFDEIEKAQSHLLVGQMSGYFRRTSKGQLRSGQVVPEPFFVHSDLTTGIQLADMIAYIVSWNVRIVGMTERAREELNPLGQSVMDLRYRAIREISSNPVFAVWSVSYINDLRPTEERIADSASGV